MIGGMLLYLAIIVIIGYRSSRGQIETAEGFLMGSRSLGPFVTIATMTMGILSGMGFFGTPAMVMRQGNYSIIIAGFGLTSFAGAWFGYKLWKYGKMYGYRTTSQVLAARYDSPFLGKIIALIQVIFMVPYMTVQFVVVGNALEYFTDVSFEVTVFAFAVIMIINIIVGGAGGTSYMDIFNAAIGVGLPLILVILAIRDGGGMDKLAEMAIANDPAFLRPGEGSTFGKMGITVFVQFITGLFAVIFSPHIMNKMMMSKDRKAIRKTILSGPFFYIIVSTPVIYMMGWIGIALYKPQLMESGMGDMLVHTVMSNHGNLILNTLLLCALLAFAMSTVNGFAMACANVVATDFVGPYYRGKGMPEELVEKKELKLSKVSIVVLALLCAALSLTVSDFVNDYAYGLATPGFAQIIPAVLGGLFWKRPGKAAAISATLSGVVTLIITTYIVPQPLGVHQVIWSLAINTVVYFIVSFAAKPSRKAVEMFFPAPQSRESATREF